MVIGTTLHGWLMIETFCWLSPLQQPSLLLRLLAATCPDWGSA
jgi:hypothetical protein